MRSTLLAFAMLARYWLTIWPVARRELRRWRRHAAAIPDPQLREQALATHRDEHLNAEGAAIFAALAPWRLTGAMVSLVVAYQVLFDYLDTVSEQPPARPEDTRCLHLALLDALDPRRPCADWYGFHGRSEDGGYVAELVAACRSSAARLPSAASVRESACSAAMRSGQVQALNHCSGERRRLLADWADRHADIAGDLHWWEFAASASSSLTVHVLAALASTPTTAADARQAERGYCVVFGALNTLLESLVDLSRDAKSGDHSFAGYYTSPDHAAARLYEIAAGARRATQSLPSRERHAVILAGMVGFYLSASEAWLPGARAASRRTLAAIGAPAPMLAAILRVRRAV